MKRLKKQDLMTKHLSLTCSLNEDSTIAFFNVTKLASNVNVGNITIHENGDIFLYLQDLQASYMEEATNCILNYARGLNIQPFIQTY